ncbi:hypothetical protein C0993_001746 [Termitomyces sp. T159_Od127]|nr:hypothetical protein C0993_001746 [Termitomyces sp. T159_Od127]
MAIYANSLLATLNSRNKLRSSNAVNSVHMSDMYFEERSALQTNAMVNNELDPFVAWEFDTALGQEERPA